VLPSQPWHQLDIRTVFDELNTGEGGLHESEARQRLARYGPNRFGEQRHVSAWQVLLHQFTSPLIYVLLAALLVSIGLSLLTDEAHWADVGVISIVLLINATIGFFQEYKAEHAVEELMKMVAPKATVRRDGEISEIEAEQIVPGDVVEIEEGGVMPADVRLFDVASLQVNEAALTGESVPVNKSDAPMGEAQDDLAASDQNNMGFMGTAVTSGHAAGVVIATGSQTRIGEIAGQVEQAGDTQTPLQRRTGRLARWITGAILLVAGMAMGIGLWMGRDWMEMVQLAIALAVAAIPEGLPIVVTVALAIGVRRMAERHAVIRRLPAVDTLGSCTIIVSDKTGTLTQNKMTVRAIYCGNARFDVSGESGAPSEQPPQRSGDQDDARDLSATPALFEALRAAVLCNNAEVPEEGAASGDPMEVALLHAGRQAGLERKSLEEQLPRIGEVPFQTERRFMATIHEQAADQAGREPGPMVWIKGAPETVLEMCANALDEQGATQDMDLDTLLAQNNALADEGLRVLAVAMGRGEDAARGIRDENPPNTFTFVGLHGLLDPPRPSAVEAVDNCHRAGIRVIMVTGDHVRTAAAIAHEVHIDRPVQPNRQPQDGPPGDVSTTPADLPEAHSGRDISNLSDEQLDQLLANTSVFARIEPAQKMRLVERLKATGQIVAVTGDGVNDAPALKAAHIGAAMGSGTDVAREASDMVVTDDNFASIYGAVEEGRTAFRNIRMATFFLLSTGAAMVLLILATLGLRWPLPMLPAQILWVNVVTNGIADVALAFEPGDRALYLQPPRPPGEGVLNRCLIERLVIVGIWLAVGTLGVFLWKWGFDFSTWAVGPAENLDAARTAALTTMVLFQMVHVFNCRSENVSIFKKSLLDNKVLLLGVLASLAVHVVAVYLPWMQNLLSLTALDATTWFVAAAVAASAIIVNELHKKFRSRLQPSSGPADQGS